MDAGAAGLQNSLAELDASQNQLLIKELTISLVQGLSATGRFVEGLALVDETIRTNGEALYLPELRRVEGGLLLSLGHSRIEEARACLHQSLELSRQQGALAWELRRAIYLAASLANQGRPQDARDLLQPVIEQFTEGRETTDLQVGERLLAALPPTKS